MKTKSPKSKPGFKLNARWILGLSMPLLLASPRSLALDISYTGRLTEASGKSVEGPLDFSVKFYNSESGGEPIGPTLTLPSTELRDGVFQLNLSLDSSQMASVFGDGTKTVFVEVEAGGKLYPRQRLIAAPLALRVPVDSSQLAYNNDGKLGVSQIELSRVTGLTAALAAKADTSAVTSGNLRASNNLSDLTSLAAARTNLGLGTLATASSLVDADISATAAIAQSKISGLDTSLAGKEPTITTGTTSQYLRGDKSWTDFNTTARGAMSITAPLTYNSGTGVFGLGQASGVANGFLSSSDFTAFTNKQAAISAATTVDAGTVTTALQNGVEIKPYGTGAGNAGELRFDDLAAGGTFYVGFKAPDTLAANRIWTLPAADGTSGQILKTDGAGNLDWIAVGGTGTVTNVTGTAPISVTTGTTTPVISMAAATTSTGGYLTSTDWNTFNNKQATLSAATSGTDGYLAMGDWTAFNGKQPAGNYITALTGDGTLSGFGAGSATLTLKNTGTVGTYVKVTTDAQGRIASGVTTIGDTDIVAAAGIDATKIGGGGVTSAEFDYLSSVTSDVQTQLNAKAPLASPTFTGVLGIPLGAAVTPSLTFTGDANTGLWSSGADTLNLSTNGSERMRVDTNGNLGIGTTAPPSLLSAGASSQFQVDSAGDLVRLKNITYSWPGAQGGASTVLTNNGSGTLSWGAATTGTVTSVGLIQPSEGITVSGGPVTGAGSITLALSQDLAAVEGISTTGGVERTAANTWSTYTLTTAGKNLIDDADITAQRTTLGLDVLATASAVSGGTAGTITDDTITDADIKSNAAIAQSKISGLTTDLAAKEPTITAGTAAQFYRGDKSWQTFDTAARGAVSITAPLTYNSGTGVFGLGQASAGADGYLSLSDFVSFNAKQAAISAATTVNAGTVTTALQNGVQVKPYGTSAGNAGELRFDELVANGTNYVGFKAPDLLAANRIWTLPAADGSNGQVLATNGTGTLSWATGAAGSVTSVDLTQPTEGITVTGGPITSSGSITLTLANDLAAVEGISTTGGVERTAANTWSTYTLTAAGKALIDDADATTQRTTLGLGALATAAAVSGGTAGTITDDTITDADIKSNAAIVDTKLATISTAGKVSGSAITSGTIAGSTILNTTGTITTSSSITGLGVNGASFMTGTGDAGASPVGGTIRAASGAGADIPGTNLTVTSGNGTGTGGSGSILFQTAPVAASSSTANNMATRMAITPDGNVGIGTTAPVAKLEIQGTGNNTNAISNLAEFGSGTSVTAGNIYAIAVDKYFVDSLMMGINKNTATGTVPANTAFISSNIGGLSLGRGNSAGLPSTADIFIAGSGNVGIGTTSPAYKLDVDGTVRATSFIGTGNSDWNNQNINNLSSLGIGTSSPAGNLSFGGAAARTLQVDRHPTANTAGNNLSVTSGGATSGATDKNGGALILSSGTATGSGSSQIEFQTASPGTAGTSDSAPTTKMVIDGNGNVGIGTTGPSAPLHVISSIDAGSGFYEALRLEGSSFGGTGPGLRFRNGTIQNMARIWANDTSSHGAALIFDTKTADGNGATTPAERMRITATGNVGIGTAAPAGSLHIKQPASWTGSEWALYVEGYANIGGFRINGADVPRGLFSSDQLGLATGSGPVTFTTGNTWERMRIANDGNVGIGTTNPSSSLHVSSGTNNWTGISLEHTSGGGGSYLFEASGNGNADGDGKFFIKDKIANAKRLTIDSTGNVGIGTTAPNSLLNVRKPDTSTSGTEINLSSFDYEVAPSTAQDAGAKRTALKGVAWTPWATTPAIKDITGVSGQASNWGTGSVESLHGLRAYASNERAAIVTTVAGAAADAYVVSGTVTDLKGLSTWTGVYGGSVTNQFGLIIYADQGGGTVTNRMGIYLNAPSGTATNDYGIYQQGTQKNYFAGNIGIGTASPAASLQVTGGSIVSTSGTTLTPTGTTETVNFATSNSQTVNLGSASGTVTLTLSGAVNGGYYSVVLVQGGTPRSVVWPASVKWEGGTTVALSGANASDVITLFYNGTNYFAVASKNFL